MKRFLMHKGAVLFVIYLIAGVNCASAQPLSSQPAKINNLEPILNTDRVLILAPHPDDETIGCAGVIQEALRVGADTHVVYLTNGEHNEFAFIVYEKRLTFKKGEFIHMGQVRQNEAIKAMQILGLERERLIFLGYPDSGTFSIFRYHWNENKPFKSLLTRISSVPYKESPSFQAPYTGQSILQDLKEVLRKYRPNKIFVSHPVDSNDDHKALYLFLKVALSDLRKELPPPKVYPYLIHRAGWPTPRYYHPELALSPPKQFLPSSISWLSHPLTPQELEKKHQAILCSKSQTESSAFYLLSFARKNELFGDYPPVVLIRQDALKKPTSEFMGFSRMFTDSDWRGPGDSGQSDEDRGGVSWALADDNELVMRIQKKDDEKNRYDFRIYLFGYRYNTPFASMPKVRVIMKNGKLEVFDGRQLIKQEGVVLDLRPDEFILKVPLGLLGDPDFILTSLKAHRENYPPDTVGFKKINIR